MSRSCASLSCPGIHVWATALCVLPLPAPNAARACPPSKCPLLLLVVDTQACPLLSCTASSSLAAPLLLPLSLSGLFPGVATFRVWQASPASLWTTHVVVVPLLCYYSCPCTFLCTPLPVTTPVPLYVHCHCPFSNACTSFCLSSWYFSLLLSLSLCPCVCLSCSSGKLKKRETWLSRSRLTTFPLHTHTHTCSLEN